MLRPAAIGVALSAFILMTLASFDLLAPIGKFLIDIANNGHPLGDFVSYWSAFHVLLSGKNPYDLRNSFELLHDSQQHLMPVYHLPWSLVLLAPVLIYPLYSALAVWFLLTLMGLIAIPYIASRIRRVPAPRILFAAFTSLSFLPALTVLPFGQFGVIFALSLSAGLWMLSCRRDFLAGIFLTLPLVKIHLFIPAGIALTIFAIRTGRWKLFAAPAAIHCAIFIFLYLHPALFTWWRVSAQSPYEWGTASIGTSLQLEFPNSAHPLLLTWLPEIAASVLVLAWSICKRIDLTAPKNITTLLCLSLACAPYAWVFDFSILLLPYSFLIAEISESMPEWRKILGGIVLVTFSILLFFLRAKLPYDYAWTWFVPAFALLWHALHVFSRNKFTKELQDS